MRDKVFYKKIVNPFKVARCSDRKYQVFFKAEIVLIGSNKHAHVSISGVHGANRWGNAYSCGQNIDDFLESEKAFSKGWNQDLYKEFIEVWKEFHLKEADKGTIIFDDFVKAMEKFPASTKECPWEDFN